jgi:hypothetical protein
LTTFSLAYQRASLGGRETGREGQYLLLILLDEHHRVLMESCESVILCGYFVEPKGAWLLSCGANKVRREAVSERLTNLFDFISRAVFLFKYLPEEIFFGGLF